MSKKMIEMYFGSPLYEAYLSSALERSGIGNIILSRRTAGGMIAGVIFLCDHYCLGVKDCTPFLESEAGYRSLYRRIDESEHLIAVDPGTFKHYITGLVRWTRDLGIEPGSQYRFCAQILIGIEENATTTFHYGKDGMPFYINGPHETPRQIMEIVNKLMAYKARTGNEVHFSIIGPVVEQLPAEFLDQVPELKILPE